MAIPTLSTLAVGDLITASRINQIKTVTDFWANPPECVATNTAATSIPNNVLTLIPYATESKDTGTLYDGAMHDNVTNNSRVAVTTSGYYLVEVRVTWTANGTGRRAVSVRKNAAGSGAAGTQIFALGIANPGGSDEAVCQSVAYVDLVAGDYIEAFGIQTSGAALTLNATAAVPSANFLHLRLLGS